MSNRELGLFEKPETDPFAELPNKSIYTKVDREKVKGAYLDWIDGSITEDEFSDILEGSVIEYGMGRNEIIELCPPSKSGRGDLPYNRSKLIKLVLLQVWRDEGDSRPATSIRDLWYSYLIYPITRIMDDNKIDNITTTIGQQLKELRKKYDFLYQDLNLESERYEFYQEAPEDSPYLDVVLAVEKARYARDFKDLASKYGISLACLGGQDSYGASEMLMFNLFDKGLEQGSELTVLGLGDYDPDGDDIGDSVREHFFDLGMGVNFQKIYITRDQIHPKHFREEGVPYTIENCDTIQGKKQKLTKYTNWARSTGGLYYDDEGKIKRFSRGNGEYKVPDFSSSAVTPLKNFRASGLRLGKMEMEFQDVDVILDLADREVSDLVETVEYYLQEVLGLAEAEAEKVKEDNYKRLKRELGIGKEEKEKHKEVEETYDDRIEDVKGEITDLRQEDRELIDDLGTRAEERADLHVSPIDDDISQAEEKITELKNKLEKKRDELADLKDKRRNEAQVARDNFWDSYRYPHVFTDILTSTAETYLKPFQSIHHRLKEIDDKLEEQDQVIGKYVRDTVEPHEFIPAKDSIKSFLQDLELDKDIFGEDAWNVQFNQDQRDELIGDIREKMKKEASKLKDKLTDIPIEDEIKNDELLDELEELGEEIETTEPGELSERQESWLAGIKVYLGDKEKAERDLVGLGEVEIREKLEEI